MDTDTVELILLPDRHRLQGVVGETILHALQRRNVPIGASCGGAGTCGECRVRFAGNAPPPTTSDRSLIAQEDLAAGWRLACNHALTETATIELHPAVESSGFPSADTANAQSTPPAVADSVGKASKAASSSGSLDCGLAIDVGTTTLNAHLLDMTARRTLGSARSRNPQSRFGADVISRIAHVRRYGEAGLRELHAAVVAGLNLLIDRLSRQASAQSSSIRAATVVGNPTMLHLLLAVDPTGIDVSPYTPKFLNSVRHRAADVGLAIHPRALVETLPAVSAYVGADIVAGILATDLHETRASTLFLDVGTNGEVVLARGSRLIACSTAAGPAFEGASIVQGLTAQPGAIESVRIVDGRIECGVIGDEFPKGLCGSGLVSAVAELRAAEIIAPSGRLAASPTCLADRLTGDGRQRRFRLTDGQPPVYLYQSDIREFQLGKAAIRAGIEILSKHEHLATQDISRVLLGGAFSSGLSSEHLISTGLLPKVAPTRIRVVGDSAGHGAQRVLQDRSLMQEAERIAQAVAYVELSGDRRFSDLFVGHMGL